MLGFRWYAQVYNFKLKNWCRLIQENNQKKSQVLDSQLKVEQLKRRQQLLNAQNELLQVSFSPFTVLVLFYADLTKA